MGAAQRRVKFGVMTLQGDAPFPELLDLWRAAEEMGFHSAWTSDHFVSQARAAKGPMNESWTSLAYLLAHTERIRGGVYVSGVTYRYPAVLAKMATTLDILSNGRLELGMGAAWHEAEHAAYGIPFYTTPERIRRLDEACEIIKKLWSLKEGERASYNGRYYTLRDAPLEPRPVQKPHPPIWVGGSGEKLTLRVVAKWADRANFPERSPDIVKRKMDVLRRHCRAVGRDYEEIEKTLGIPFIGTDREKGRAGAERVAHRQGLTMEEVAATCYWGTTEEMRAVTQRYVDLGITTFIVLLVPPFPWDDFRRFGQDVLLAFQ